MTEVMLRERLGELLPEGVAIGPNGEPTRDPALARRGGALLPFGGHKGFGLALMMTQLIERIKATPRQPGIDEIRIPSERAFRARERAHREGIEIDRRVFDALVGLRTRPG